MNRLDLAIKTQATLRNVLIAMGVFILFSVIIFNTGFIPTLSQIAPDVSLLDNTFGYSTDDVREVLVAYGEEGRRLYQRYLLIFDFVYAVVFAVSNSLFLAYLLTRLFPAVSYLRLLYLLPFGGLILDFLENIGILTLLTSYPSTMAGLVPIVSTVTMVKLILVNLVSVIMLIALVGVLIQAIYQRFRKTS
ncbi:MAG: hypothetical protein AAF639_09880 [Chloroflexota bacterium]